mmetsp:Transcript_65113/g.209893  ORF Transcript_65113/g.209893 Transcript_65113/m.209893 type:complete len:207 (+) Transcript_65113:1523-2143(+)
MTGGCWLGVGGLVWCSDTIRLRRSPLPGSGESFPARGGPCAFAPPSSLDTSKAVVGAQASGLGRRTGKLPSGGAASLPRNVGRAGGLHVATACCVPGSDGSAARPASAVPSGSCVRRKWISLRALASSVSSRRASSMRCCTKLWRLFWLSVIARSTAFKCCSAEAFSGPVVGLGAKRTTSSSMSITGPALPAVVITPALEPPGGNA